MLNSVSLVGLDIDAYRVVGVDADTATRITPVPAPPGKLPALAQVCPPSVDLYTAFAASPNADPIAINRVCGVLGELIARSVYSALAEIDVVVLVHVVPPSVDLQITLLPCTPLTETSATATSTVFGSGVLTTILVIPFRLNCGCPRTVQGVPPSVDFKTPAP